jgi:hypothetical protein
MCTHLRLPGERRVTVLAMTEESQLRSIEEALVRNYGERLPQDRIHAEFEAARAAFADARIRNFVPVLIQRDAADRIRKLPGAVAA